VRTLFSKDVNQHDTYGILPKVFENVLSLETLLAWPSGQRQDKMREGCQTNYQNSMGRKQANKTTQLQTCATLQDKGSPKGQSCGCKGRGPSMRIKAEV
jgi:hypothetical protein